MNLFITLLLRLGVGLVLINAFIGKVADRSITSLSFYAESWDLSKLDKTANYISGAFKDSVLPEALVSPYATILPWAELVVGVIVLLGVVSRSAFGLAAGIFASLLLGQLILGDLHKCVMIGTYLAASLAGFAMISERKKSGQKLIGVDDLFGGKVTVE